MYIKCNLKKVLIMCFLALPSLLTACSSHYVISTSDGHLIKTHSKPEIDKSTGLITYKDTDGTQHEIHSNDVKEIAEE